MLHDLVIIGSGPAGLTAAIYASRAGLKPILIEGSKPGGQLMSTSLIENWPGEESIMGPQLMIKMMEQAKKLGTTFISGNVTGSVLTNSPFSCTLTTQKTIQAKSIIIATGATPRTLQCPGEETYWGRGVSTCAVCDGAFYENKHVIVVGGGDSGMEYASFLAKKNKVTLVHISDELTASHHMQQRIHNHNNVSIIYNSTVSAIKGTPEHITHVEITNQHDQQTQTLEAQAVFLAIGLTPNSQPFADLACSSYGHIKVTEQVKTSIPGIFAAGDVQDPIYRQAVVSAGFGCMAALQAERFLTSQ